MKQYYIEHKISSLSDCAVTTDAFDIDGIQFTHWDFNERKVWKDNAWLATATINSNGYIPAINEFRSKLAKITPRISLISQAYIEHQNEPFLVQELGGEHSWLRYARNNKPVPLMFTNTDKIALNELLGKHNIPESFYHYWNDAVNAIGYSAKIECVNKSV